MLDSMTRKARWYNPFLADAVHHTGVWLMISLISAHLALSALCVFRKAFD